ncbi:hypothetical protein FPOAC2_09592 [Fusarium poae]|uniref:Mei2-like C-terminal RNA recognition motif domain-containing protein n=1 Tax=Fusarium poae TaxID=36050 RepID=A0A1B8APM0_FUSPO|nr:hypothetical protein FPOA_08772 [Fusarium poae]
MLRNIPNKVDQPLLKRIVDASSYGKYDFMYLRIDFANDCNVGYAYMRSEQVDKRGIPRPMGLCDTPTSEPEEVQSFTEELQAGGMAVLRARHVETDGSLVLVVRGSWFVQVDNLCSDRLVMNLWFMVR